MTWFYTDWDIRYLEAKNRGCAPPISASESAPIEEMPDMNEAERVWKLLVDAARGT